MLTKNDTHAEPATSLVCCTNYSQFLLISILSINSILSISIQNFYYTDLSNKIQHN